MDPKVSVIIPTWNRQSILERAICSALNQSYAVSEVLVCDDGSTDQSESVVKNFSDQRVRWLRGEHAGLPASPRNRGLREARGDWIAFLDSDDEWLPRKIEEQLRELNAEGQLASCSNAVRFVPGEGGKGPLLSFEKKRLDFNDMMKNNQVITSSCVLHRSVVKICGNFPEAEWLRGVEDYAYWLRVATQTDYVYLKQPLVAYRDDPLNSIRGLDKSDEAHHKELVFKDFLSWAGSVENVASVDASFVRLSREAYNSLKWRKIRNVAKKAASDLKATWRKSN